MPSRARSASLMAMDIRQASKAGEIAVLGGTGTLGAHVVNELRRGGHAVRIVSRTAPDHPADLRTGEGLDAALSGARVVVNAANSTAARGAGRVLVDGTHRLLAAEERAGVEHHIDLAIVGADLVPLSYYKLKIEQERVVRAATVPTTIVRATQFHELLAAGFAAGARWRVLPGGHVPIQPVAAAEVAALVAAVATGPSDGPDVTIGGPHIEDLGTLARAWLSHTGHHALRILIPPLGRTARSLRAGALTTTTPTVSGTTTFAAWLDGG